MGNRRTAMLVPAIALGAVAALAVWGYLGSVQERAYKGARLAKVFVVKKDVRQGLPAERAIGEGFIQPDQIPEKFRPTTAITDLGTIRGKIALSNLSPGQIVGQGTFVEPNEVASSFAQRIPADQVAISVEVDPVHGVANLVVPGDKVNILVVTPDGARPLFQRVDVIAVGTTTRPGGDRSADAKTAGDQGLVTFAVPMLAAEKIALAASTSPEGLYLTLAPPDSEAVVVPPIAPGGLFQGPLSPYT